MNGGLAYQEVFIPEGPSTQYLRTPVPKTEGTGVLKYWVLGPSGRLEAP